MAKGDADMVYFGMDFFRAHRVFWRGALLGAVVLVWVCGFAQAQVVTRELPIGADYCTILRAFTNAPDGRCPAAKPLGAVRSTGSAATSRFPKEAVTLAESGTESGYFIRFAFNSVELTPEYEEHVKRLSAVFKSPAMAGVCIKLMGHTDEVGSDDYNMRLSVARAKMIQTRLMADAGLPASQVSFDGLGERQPIPNVPKAHPLNRRVEILAKAQTSTGCS
jgi:outer membrane protein OmpA-like peptidoglycan-associated protein